MSKLNKYKHIKGVAPPPLFNVSKIRAVSDKEAEERAKNDLDAPPITQEDVRSHKVKKI